MFYAEENDIFSIRGRKNISLESTLHIGFVVYVLNTDMECTKLTRKSKRKKAHTSPFDSLKPQVTLFWCFAQTH